MFFLHLVGEQLHDCYFQISSNAVTSTFYGQFMSRWGLGFIPAARCLPYLSEMSVAGWKIVALIKFGENNLSYFSENPWVGGRGAADTVGTGAAAEGR